MHVKADNQQRRDQEGYYRRRYCSSDCIVQSEPCTERISAQTGMALLVDQNLVKRSVTLEGPELPVPLPKSGRPKLLSSWTLKVISRQVRSNHSLTAREVKERNPCLLSRVTSRYVEFNKPSTMTWDLRAFVPAVNLC
ncbi:hypothetical protein Hamer_G021731, partial [Homarus americanus]